MREDTSVPFAVPLAHAAELCDLTIFELLDLTEEVIDGTGAPLRLCMLMPDDLDVHYNGSTPRALRPADKLLAYIDSPNKPANLRRLAAGYASIELPYMAWLALVDGTGSAIASGVLVTLVDLWAVVAELPVGAPEGAALPTAAERWAKEAARGSALAKADPTLRYTSNDIINWTAVAKALGHVEDHKHAAGELKKHAPKS